MIRGLIMTVILAAKLIEPINVGDILERLKGIARPPFIDISEDEPPLAPKPERAGEVRYFYDEIKEDDFIAEPSFYGYSYELTDEERDLVERAVMHEAGWCPDYRLLILTAQCFRNDCELNGWGPSETFDKCGYAAMDYANPRAVKAVREVFDEGVECVPEKIFCYYNSTMVSSPCHEKNRLAIDIDGNRFFY